MTDDDLAAHLQRTLTELHALRKRHRWPCVKLGRFAFRFTDQQVDEIISRHTHQGLPPSPLGLSGQTARSAALSRQAGQGR